VFSSLREVISAQVVEFDVYKGKGVDNITRMLYNTDTL